MTWPAAIVWLLILGCTFPRSPIYLLYLLFGLGAFTMLSIAPGETNVVPQAGCSVFFICKVLLSQGRLPRALDAASDPGQLGLLFIFLAYGVFAGYVMPRFFAQMVEVIPMSVTVDWGIPLQPTTSNYAQSAYMMLSVGVALTMYLLAESVSFQQHFLRATFVGGLVLIATGIIDATFAAAGLASLLDPFRNASYSIIKADEIDGARRVIGFMPEASAYGTACVVAASSLAFLRPCFEDERWRNVLVPLGIAGLLAMAVISTSSTAYAGLGVLAAVYGVNWLRRAMSRDSPGREGLQTEAIAAIAALLAILVIVAVVPSLLDPVFQRLDALIFKKTESASYAERSMWTHVAMQAFVATYGLGVGLGGARTSNWFASIVSNTGVFGTTLLFAFILWLYVRRYTGRNPAIAEFVTGLKFSLIPQFAMLGLSGTTPDLGVGLASALGLIAALTRAPARSAYRPEVTTRRQVRARSRR